MGSGLYIEPKTCMAMLSVRQQRYTFGVTITAYLQNRHRLTLTGTDVVSLAVRRHLSGWICSM